MIQESDIPDKYRKGKAKPAKTVAELIAQLNQLPPKLQIFHGFGNKVQVGVTHLLGAGLRLTLDEVD